MDKQHIARQTLLIFTRYSALPHVTAEARQTIRNLAHGVEMGWLRAETFAGMDHELGFTAQTLPQQTRTIISDLRHFMNSAAVDDLKRSLNNEKKP